MKTLLLRTPFRRGHEVALLAVTLATGCNRILGVDGEYELRTGAIEAGAPLPPPAAPPMTDARPSPTDGAVADDGGVVEVKPDAGEAGTPERDAGADADAGNVTPPPDAEPDPPDAMTPEPPCTVCPFTCPPLNYRGSVTGQHKIASVFFDVWSTIDADLEVTLEPGIEPLLPRLRGTLIPITSTGTPTPHTTLHGRLEGTLDCTSRKVQSQLVSGARTALTRQNIEGSFTGELRPDGSLSGTFTEWETANPALTGNGAWSATRTGP